MKLSLFSLSLTLKTRNLNSKWSSLSHRRRWSPDDDVDGRIKATKYFHHCSPIKSEKKKEKVTSPKLRRISIDQIGHWRRGLVRLTCFVCVVISCWLSPERWNSNVENYKILSPSLWNAFNLLDITVPLCLWNVNDYDRVWRWHETFRRCMGFCRDPIYYE